MTRLIARRLKGRLPTGIDRVGLAYLHHFSRRANALVRAGALTLVLPLEASRELFRILQTPGQGGRLRMLALLMRASLHSAGSERLRGQFVVNTGHSGLESVDYVRRLHAQRVRPLLMVHDLIPITHPEYCRQGEKQRHIARMDHLLSSASGVIANSRATLDELGRYARKRGVVMPPAIAAPLAPASLPVPSSRRPVAQPYFVVLSTIEPRKNHSMLLQLWRTLAERMGNHVPRLLVIGQRGWESEHTVALLERCESIRDAVAELGTCGDGELATYLHHAQALLFPSFAEGYGLPLMEALAMGVPVIASDLPAFREIAGDVPDYIDPIDGLGWMRMVQEYAVSESPRREAQRIRLSAFTLPTWRGHFAEVDRFMRKLAC